VNIHLNGKENYAHFLDIDLHLSRLFSVSVSLDFLCKAHALFPERLPSNCQALCLNFSKSYTKYDAVPLLDLSRNRNRLDTRPQIKGRIVQISTSNICVKFCTLTPKI
jgi:hypothetical protein